VRRVSWSVLILAALVAAGIGGFWIGRADLKLPRVMEPEGEPQAPSGPVIYYQDPDGKPIYSAEPKSTPDGRPYLAVHASEEVNFDDAAKSTLEPVGSPVGERCIRYYRNPMGLPDISQTPKKDSMGMDYIPVYEGEDDDGSTVKLTPGKLQRIGVKSEPAMLRVIAEPVRAPGTIQLDERRIAVVSLRAEAFIESVENVTSGSKKGNR
jgi:membrane fusion protein, copper/silver efflux system